jgi:subtilisin family serine protease
MQGDRRLLYAEPNFYGEAPEGGGRGIWAWAGNNPDPIGEQYAADLLNLDVAHALNQGAGVVVAVLDTGVQLDHPQLCTQWTTARYDFVDDDAIPTEDFATLDRNQDGYVDESAGHGTHVAGIVHFAAPEAQIMPLRVLDATGRGNVFLIAEALLYAREQGVDVINLSLGTTGESQLLNEIIAETIADYDTVVVAAAGNLNSNVEMYPAATEDVIAVSAVNQNRQRSSFANYGPWVDIAAPGDRIGSAYPENGYAYWSGTSMATPFVAAQAALLRSHAPELSAADVVECMRVTAQLGPNALGAGVIDLAASLQAVGVTCALSVNPDGSAQDSDQALSSANRLFMPVVVR